MKTFYNDKTILITGAASGIGKRFAEKVSEAESVRLILWDRNPEILNEVRQDLQPQAEVHVSGLDVRDSELIQLEADHLIKENLVPDIIVNCAGIVTGKMFHEHTLSEIERILQINTIGSMWVARAFLNEMMKRGTGRIVNIASASGYIGNPRMSVYAASKWAVIGWSDSLRLEMDKLQTGIGVTTVIPSYIKTGMFEGVKAPLLVPLLETDEIVNLMLRGIAKGKKTIQAPFMVRWVPLIKAVLPDRIFDWVAGNLLGVYRSMDSFKGRNQRSSLND